MTDFDPQRWVREARAQLRHRRRATLSMFVTTAWGLGVTLSLFYDAYVAFDRRQWFGFGAALFFAAVTLWAFCAVARMFYLWRRITESGAEKHRRTIQQYADDSTRETSDGGQ